MRDCNRMKCLGSLGCFSRLILGFVLSAVVAFSADAQIQQAWVAHYNNGITNGTNQAVKMALDSTGNIYVTGFSQNTNTNLGYVTIKYAPNGNQLWVARYDSTNYPTATPSALALDSSNNAIVTGSAITVKYDTNGNQLWTAPYAGVNIYSYNPTALAVDARANVYVTGYGPNFNTVKLNPLGSNVWSASYNSGYGPAASQAVVVDGSGNVYVAGWDTYVCYQEGSYKDCHAGLLTAKYDSNGNQVWINVPQGGTFGPLVVGMSISMATNLYILANGHNQPWSTYCYAPDGSEIWAAGDPTNNGYALANGLAVDQAGSVFTAGQIPTSYSGPSPLYSYATVRLGTNGSQLWTSLFPVTATGINVATALTLDRNDNCYVTGYSPGTNGTNNIVTIKYGPNGNQVWVQQYNGLNSGDDAGNAIAVDNNGNVYVTGYETLSGGGTGIVTIKYIPLSLQRRSDGTVLLEVQGSPGESFDIQASADLLNWTDLGSVLADTNGLMQFNDTSAPNFPARFYVPKPQ
jgi:hypothetical protein